MLWETISTHEKHRKFEQSSNNKLHNTNDTNICIFKSFLLCYERQLVHMKNIGSENNH